MITSSQKEGLKQTEKGAFTFGAEEMSCMCFSKLQKNQSTLSCYNIQLPIALLLLNASREIQMQIADTDITMFALGGD